MKKTFLKLLLVFFLMVIYSYTLAIENIPENLVIFEGENIALKTLFGMQIKMERKTLETSSTTNINQVSQKSGKATLKLSLFDNIPLKNVNVDVLPKTKVIPCRQCSWSKTVYKWGISRWHERNRRTRQQKI